MNDYSLFHALPLILAAAFTAHAPTDPRFQKANSQLATLSEVWSDTVSHSALAGAQPDNRMIPGPSRHHLAHHHPSHLSHG